LNEMEAAKPKRRRMNVMDWLCVGCGYCESMCPTGAIRVNGAAEINQHICIGCTGCAGRCPMGAIEVLENQD